jgi:thioredoxin-related protein
VKFLKTNINENRELAGTYAIRSVPHILIAKGTAEDGNVKVLKVINGANVATIKAAIQKYK